MPAYSEERVLPYTPAQLYALVADIEKYPEFLPWVAAARITERHENELRADLVAAFKNFRETFTSHVILESPAEEMGKGSIHVELVEGPFHNLENRWVFLPEGPDKTRVQFFIDFRFRSKMLEKLIGFLFEQALATMVSAFEKRANILFGKGN
ncbi:MAG: type II toxin-antitoxin system RatA family toxin [Rickettsiales bacterium]|nr:type II toxin-antitoxin system RatA family toxin [Rickettsiales bacterium]